MPFFGRDFVRWSRNLGYGYGMPLFQFYGPTPYYIASGILFLSQSPIFSIKMLYFVFTFLGAMGMFVYAKRWFGVVGATVSSVAFLVFPYRMLDIYVRGAWNEMFAISMVPWILHGIELAYEKSHAKSILFISFFSFLMFTSHNLMTLMFVPVLVGYALVRASRQNLRALLSIGSGFLLGGGMAMFYLLPSFFEKQYTRVDTLIGGYGNYKFHFLYLRQLFSGTWGYGGSILGIEDGLSFSLGVIQIALMCIAGIAYLRSFRQFSRSTHKVVLYAIVVLGASLLLSSFKSSFIWDRVPLMSYFQFPWRFLSIATLIIPLLIGSLFTSIREAVVRASVAASCIFALLLSIGNTYLPKERMENPEALYYTDVKKIQKEMSGILPDYIPITISQSEPPVPDTRVSFKREGPSVDTKVDRTHEMLVQTRLSDPNSLVFSIAIFPGWTFYINGEKVEPIITDAGIYEVPLEAGEWTVSARFESTPLRRIADGISIVAWFVYIGVTLYADYRKH